MFQLLPKGRFGFLFDIDGVIVRGKKLLPSAREAFRLLTDRHGNFQTPALFVTNAGNSLRSNKAHQLSQWLGINVSIICVEALHILCVCVCCCHFGLMLWIGLCTLSDCKTVHLITLVQRLELVTFGEKLKILE